MASVKACSDQVLGDLLSQKLAQGVLEDRRLMAALGEPLSGTRPGTPLGERVLTASGPWCFL